jgi:hypothetical protein
VEDGKARRTKGEMAEVLAKTVGFRFEAEKGAVILDGWAHRRGCPQLPAPIPANAQLIPAGGVFLSKRCPHACRTCAPRSLTLLSHQVAGDGHLGKA